jgi:hypothetical protein
VQRLEFSVHEFMTIMGHLDFKRGSKPLEGGASVYDEWYDQWRQLDTRLESLDPLPRADMLFDAKVVINTITDAQLFEVIGVVQEQINMHKELIETDDEDADPEDLEGWEKRLVDLEKLQNSNNYVQ